MPEETVYLAAAYSRREEMCQHRDDLESFGYRVEARWLLGEDQAYGPEAVKAIESAPVIDPVHAALFANDDLEDILNSDVVIVFSEPSRQRPSRGGRHVEFGVALALKRIGISSRAIFLVGPVENIFHALPEVDARFETWEECLSFLKHRAAFGGLLEVGVGDGR